MGWDTILPGEREELIRMKLDQSIPSYELRKDIFLAARENGTLPEVCEECYGYKIPTLCYVVQEGSCNESNLTFNENESSLIEGAVAIRE